MVYAPEEQALFTGSSDKTVKHGEEVACEYGLRVKKWNVQTGFEVKTLDGHTDRIACMVYVHVPEEQALIMASYNNMPSLLITKYAVAYAQGSYVVCYNFRHQKVSTMEGTRLHDIHGLHPRGAGAFHRLQRQQGEEMECEYGPRAEDAGWAHLWHNVHGLRPRGAGTLHWFQRQDGENVECEGRLTGSEV